MQQLEEHPSVVSYRRSSHRPADGPAVLDAEWLKQLCLEAGADDAGFVEVGRSDMDGDRADILQALPGARSLIAIVCRMNRGSIRSTHRASANLEFHHTGDAVNEAARRVVAVLEARGVRAMNPSMGFPMEMDRWGKGKTWTVSHKKVAVAAGLGRMGIHRNVIHPRFGSFVLLGTILIDAEVSQYNRPIDYNPCLECKLCVAACPTGAIHADGYFDFSACTTHNYREFMGGFTDWVGQVVSSKNVQDYTRRVSEPETVSMWQSLSFGANYKAAYCISVCPAGDDVIGPFLENRPAFLDTVVRPLQEKEETVYVLADSDAEKHVLRRFKNKKVKRVGNGLSVISAKQFLRSLPLIFQRGAAAGLEAAYHFVFHGEEEISATVMIRNQSLQVVSGCQGRADLVVEADSRAWVGFLRHEKSLLAALLLRKIKVRGPLKLLRAFAKCFPAQDR